MANRFTLFCMRFPPLSFNFTLCFLYFSFDHDYACPPLYLLSPSPWSSLTRVPTLLYKHQLIQDLTVSCRKETWERKGLFQHFLCKFALSSYFLMFLQCLKFPISLLAAALSCNKLSAPSNWGKSK